MERPYTIQYEDRGSYLAAFVTGAQDSFAVSIGYWTELAAECRARGHERLLVVESFAQKGPLVDVYNVAAQLPALLRGVLVAFVDRELGDAEQNMFAETVALNRGGRGKLFGDEKAAIAWLQAATP